MLIGCIADDFTGASDVANTLARAGLHTVQFVGAPGGGLTECEAGVIALKSRSIPAADAVHQSLAALAALKAAGARQILFKYCSTFDSTHEGNIGPVADALLDALDAPVAIVCPAFPATGRTLYRGHLFVGDALLNESGMEKHPLNPMRDANLVRWLSYQTRHPVGLIGIDIVARGADAVRGALDAAGGRGERLVVCDAIADADLRTLGRAAAGMALVTGGSGIAMGLPANFERAAADALHLAAPEGPAVALSGSCSRATLAQVAEHARHGPVLQLDAAALIDGRFTPEHALAWFDAQEAELPLIASTAAPDHVAAVQATHGTAEAAQAVEAFFAALAQRLVARGVRRLITAGGETSSAVVSALGRSALAIGPEIDPGVPVLIAEGTPTLALALKSGNFGAPDFFTKALRTMAAMPAASS